MVGRPTWRWQRRDHSLESDRRAAGRTDEQSSMCRRCESIKSSPLSSKHFNEHTQVSFNSRTSVFQADDEGAIPSTRSILRDRRSPRRCAASLRSSRFSDEERGLQNRARGFDSLSALYRKCREDYMDYLPSKAGPARASSSHPSLRLRITTGWLPWAL